MLADTTKDNWPKKWTEFLTFLLRIFTSLQREGHHAKAETKDLNAMEVDAVEKKGKNAESESSDTEEEKKPKKKSSSSKTKGKSKETAAHISDRSIHSKSEPDASESDEDFAAILSRLRRLRANGSSSSRKVGEGSSRRDQKGFLKGDL
ncbi:uncharacterized protein LAESUDRAFT_756195 [Laetiporus sulphureus 93-53]|uniref:Uncharacterized protein n=1 Tax=Laetiporus sulphureus 93-53 TaxID=1314785 RepID=A0A165G8K8_9APHY|nr:uncharacterized protein LAESUDRAFT_756195 [Laetiporus sulphureus 93-53]KZT09980.1 hypothetical protein LAESUDRAFT_756195 [Laetiporus sulphureus 93-53]